VTQTGGTTTTTGAGLSFEAEKLTVARCTVGTAEKVNLVDGNLAKSGQFGGDTIVHWAGMEEPGAVLELRVPIATPGRYSVTVGIARSWDYGVYQFLLDGQEKGSRVDFASKAGEEKVLPAKIDLGTVSAKKPALVLGIRFIGESPNAIPGPNPMSMGIDWVRLTPAPTPGGKPARPGK
jgi:hypothetical protein